MLDGLQSDNNNIFPKLLIKEEAELLNGVISHDL